eukprot:3536831-Amphidinium_carterae.1
MSIHSWRSSMALGVSDALGIMGTLMAPYTTEGALPLWSGTFNSKYRRILVPSAVGKWCDHDNLCGTSAYLLSWSHVLGRHEAS